MPFRPAHELTIDELFERAWRAKDDEHALRWPRGRRHVRDLTEEIRDQLRRRGFDLDLADELSNQMPEVDGHADLWRIFLDAELLGRTVRAMATPFESERITKVVAIEARGFLLGGAVAVQLGSGFAAVRKASGHLPGPQLAERAERDDYRGQRHELSLQTRALRRRDRVLLVDDWIEMGSQAAAARKLVERAGATFVGTSVIVNQLPIERADQFGRLRYLVRYFPHDK